MGNIRENFVKRYGLGEYILFALGAIVLGYQVFSYMTDSLDGDMLDGVFALMGILSLLAPMSLLDFVRKRGGLETKGDKEV